MRRATGPADDARARAESAHPPGRSAAAPARLLVVDDEPKMADLIRRAIEERGWKADVAGCGEDALRLAATAGYDVIVLDVMLPGLDGVETCRALRARGERARVLMLTARDSPEDRAAGLGSGADGYLTKPFSLADLLGTLEDLLRAGDGGRLRASAR